MPNLSGNRKYYLLALVALGWMCCVYGFITYRPFNGLWLLFLIGFLTGMWVFVYFLSQPQKGGGESITFDPTRKFPKNPPEDTLDSDNYDDAA